jgi:hypothetical protein
MKVPVFTDHPFGTPDATPVRMTNATGALDMSTLKISKFRLVAFFGLSIFLGISSVEDEAKAFRLTAPTDALMTLSTNYLAARFKPSQKEQIFISLAIPQARTTPN